MSTIYEYAYYLEGDYIAILQKGTDSVSDPYYLTEEQWLTPSTADSDGVMIRYTKSPTVPTTETSDLGISRRLSLAVVEYVRARMAEKQGNELLAQRYMNKFKIMVRQHTNNKVADSRNVIPTGAAVLR
jgi:hypothetical protein